jgi:hypothetical protein
MSHSFGDTLIFLRKDYCNEVGMEDSGIRFSAWVRENGEGEIVVMLIQCRYLPMLVPL